MAAGGRGCPCSFQLRMNDRTTLAPLTGSGSATGSQLGSELGSPMNALYKAEACLLFNVSCLYPEPVLANTWLL
jgi:hypothetical protein